MKKVCILILVLLTNIILISCSSTSVSLSEKYKGKSENELFTKAENALVKKDYKDAAEYYEALQTIYPLSKYSEQTQLNLIFAYLKDDDQDSAVAAADRFINLYPRSENVDYAIYLKGLANFNQKRGMLQNVFYSDISQRDFGTMKQSFNDFNILVNQFPHSKFSPDARQRMIYLRDMFAKFEVDTAKYYFSQKDYVAAVNRANYVIKHLQGTAHVKDALVIMIQANRKLGLEKPAHDALRILSIYYPEALNSLDKPIA